MKVLIVKTSSMGDIIHALPALTDAVKAIPNIKFDWVLEEGFVEVPSWHNAVDEIIPVAIRRWRKHPIQAIKSGEIKRFRQRLQSKKYDLVIDAQASYKSAIVTYFALGPRCGLDWRSSREPFVQLSYDKTFYVNRKQHAIKILRQLFAQALNYPFIDDQPDYGIDPKYLVQPPVDLPKQYVVFIHATNWVTKCWPEAYWYELANKVAAAGYPILLPWGAPHEYERAQRIAASCPSAIVLPKLKLAEIATILAHAKAAVCVDTGLGHLTAALNTPAVTLYGPTNPALIGATGLSQKHMVAQFPCAPCKQKVCTYKKTTEQQPACFMSIPTQKVWDEFSLLL